MKKTVTLISPCYNMEKYIRRLLDSVLSQTYEDIEMIVVDDGSTDGSADIIRTYFSEFKRKGYTLTLLQQKNQGQAAAIYNALPLVNGKYLAWPDCDDYYATDNAIERMLNALRAAGPEFAVVRTQKRKVDAESGDTVGIQGLDVKLAGSPDLFEDCLYDRNGWYFCSGAYLVDFDVFKCVTGLRMFHKKGVGQNWQMLLPVLYSYRCTSIPEPLYTVVLRKDSHCRTNYNLPRRIYRKHLYLRLLLSTIWSIGRMPVKVKFKHSLKIIQRYGFFCSSCRFIIKTLKFAR